VAGFGFVGAVVAATEAVVVGAAVVAVVVGVVGVAVASVAEVLVPADPLLTPPRQPAATAGMAANRRPAIREILMAHPLGLWMRKTISRPEGGARRRPGRRRE
jgi:hypothetical protein